MQASDERDRFRAKIAALESKLDLCESELTHLDRLLRECGFPNGIITLKATVEELILETRGNRCFPDDIDV